MTIERIIEILERKTSIPKEGETWDEIDNAYDEAVEILKRITEPSHIHYEVRNTTDEYGHEEITARCDTMEGAKRILKNICDWYRKLGTGRIYEVTEELRYVPVKSEKVYEV